MPQPVPNAIDGTRPAPAAPHDLTPLQRCRYAARVANLLSGLPWDEQVRVVRLLATAYGFVAVSEAPSFEEDRL